MPQPRLHLVPLLLLLFALLSGPARASQAPEFDADRAKLLSYLLRDQLSRHHYSHKPLDDELSRHAFQLYLQQLDFQKRFLLQKDVARLRAHAARIDDELRRGTVELPAAGAALMAERVVQVRRLAEEILAGDFDFTRREEFETDPEKLSFCADEAELRERWRQTLKFQVLTRYLNLLEDEGEGAKPAELLARAKQKVSQSYDDFFTRLLSETPQDHVDRYFDAVARAFDPHTNYLPPSQKEDFDIGMRGSLEGIGATLREEDGYIRVVSIIPGSPAARQGQLHAEDVILMVAQGTGEPVDVTDARLRDAVGLIRGPKGTEVRLTVKKPDGTRLVIPIVRDVVQIEETFVKSAVLRDEPSGRSFGYIKVPSFYRDFQKTQHGQKGRNATDDVRAELEKLKAQKVDGLVLDLRNNGGGALTDAVAVTGLFLASGPVVQVKGSGGELETLADPDPALVYGGPLVVLVNRFSASASEIVAGALQDYGRAVVVGSDHTHGKGTVQAVIDLDRSLPFANMERYKPLGAMRVTTQKFYRVSGASTQFRGVEPDIVLPDRLRHLKSGERHLDHALPWDTVPATAYARWPQTVADLAGLRTGSGRRLTGDEDFADIVREAERAAARMEQTRQSLNLEEVRRERAAAGKAHAEPGDGEPGAKPGGEPADEEAKRQAWMQALRDDPYVREATAVLGDTIAAPPGGRAAETAGTVRPPAPFDRSPYSRPRAE